MKLTFKTRLEKGADAVQTTADIEWSGITPEQMQQLASRSVVIMLQATYRIAGSIPTTDTVNVADLLKRERGVAKLDTPQARAAAFTRLTAKMTPAELAQLANQLRVVDTKTKTVRS